MQKKFLLAISAFFLFLVVGVTVFAQNIIVSTDVDIYLNSIGRTVHIMATSNALDQLSINDAGTAFTVTTSLSNGSVVFTSDEGLDMGGTNNSSGIALTYCDERGSRLTITANSSDARVVTVTPAGGICAASSPPQSGGVGSSGGSSGGLALPPAAPPASGTSTQKPGTFALDTGFPELKMSFTGTRKLSATNADALVIIVSRMIDKKTLIVPSINEVKINPFAKTSLQFGLRVALAVSGVGCGDPITSKTCKAAAAEKEFIAAKIITSRDATRGEYYEMLFRAADLPPVLQKLSLTQADLCSDVPLDHPFAQAIATAKFYGIASIYTGNKCNLNLPFPRYEAALFAERTLEVIAKKASGKLPKLVTVQMVKDSKGKTSWSPSIVTVNVSDLVRFINKTKDMIWPASAVHPTHKEYPVTGGCIGSKFDACQGLEEGESFSFKFTKAGTFQYHDHLTPSRTGTVIVK